MDRWKEAPLSFGAGDAAERRGLPDSMTRIRTFLQLICLLSLAGCTLPFLRRPAGPPTIPQTPDYTKLAYQTPNPYGSPSPLPTSTLTQTVTRDLGWRPSPTPEPTFSPYRWACVEDGSPDPCHRVFRDIAVRPDGDGWAVGERGLILRRTGGSWVRVASPVDLTLRRVFPLSAGDAWAIADQPYAAGPEETGYRSLLLHWNGSGWSVFSNPAALGYIVDASFLSARAAWAISYDDSTGGAIYAMIRWDGTDWSPVVQTPELNAVAMLSLNNGWAVGAGGLILHWEGKEWSEVESPTDADLEILTFTSADSGWAASSEGVILVFAAGEWREYSNKAPYPRAMVMDPEGGDGWMLGSGNRGEVVFRWDGSDWKPFFGDVPDGEVLALDYPVAGEAWAAGWVPGGSRAGMIWRWDGAGWIREIEKVPLPVQDVTFISGSDAWAVGEKGLLLHWDGTEWMAAESPTNQALKAVAFSSPDDGWAAGEGGQILHWDGESWSEEQPYRARGSVYNRIDALAFPAADDGWAAGSREGGDYSAPWMLHWDGDAWTEVTLYEGDPPCKCSLNALYFSSANDGWAVGGGERSILFHWDGSSWQLTTGPYQYRLLAVGGAAADDVWAAGVAEDAASYSNPGLVLHWDGSAWVSYSFPAQVTGLDSIRMLSPNDGWMAGNGLLHWNGRDWGTVYSPVDGVVIALSQTPDGALWAVTDTGSVLKLSASR